MATFETPLDDVDPSDLEGFEKVLPGRYHAMVQEVTVDNKNQLVVDFEILHGTVQSEIGKTHREYFSPKVTVAKRPLAFAVACGITTEEELQELKTQRRSFSNYDAAVGKHLKIEIIEEEYEAEKDGVKSKRKSSKIGFVSFWRIDSPKANDIPVNQGAMAEGAGDDNPFGGETGGSEAGVSSDSGDENPFGV
jgi:hypothetical protein